MRKPLLGELKARAVMMHPAPAIVEFPYRADWYPDCVILYYRVALYHISTRVAVMRNDLHPVLDMIVTTRSMSRREKRHYNDPKTETKAARARKRYAARARVR